MMRLAKRTTRWRGRLASRIPGPHVDRMALEAEEVVELPAYGWSRIPTTSVSVV